MLDAYSIWSAVVIFAPSGFRDDKRRCDEIEPVRRSTPPFARNLLIRRNYDIAGWSRRKVADH